MSRTASPWKDVPAQAPYWLQCDAAYIRAFNDAATNPAVRIKENAFPEPYFGNPVAPVVLLLLNPGGGAADADPPTEPRIQAALRREFSSKVSATAHLHLLQESEGLGHAWWVRTCRALLRDVPVTKLQTRLLSLEFSAYHSKSFGHGLLRLPSQEFTFALVRRAVARQALIVCMRGEKHWLGAVPELFEYSKLFKLKNPRSASVSPGNILRYQELVDVLSE